MPTSGRLCNKCRSGLTSDGDTWCRFCSSVGALNESSRYRYQSLAFRSLAEEVVVQCCRQVQALSQLDRQVHSERTSLSDRLANAKNKLEEVTNQVDRSATPKSAGGGDLNNPALRLDLLLLLNPPGLNPSRQGPPLVVRRTRT